MQSGRSAAIGGWLAVVVLLLSCSPPDPVGQLRRLWTGRHAIAVDSRGLGPLHGLVVSNDGLVVVPNSAWQVHRETKQWFFSGSGTLLCHVARRPRLPVSFGFLPAAETAGRPLRVYFNGDEMSDRLRTRSAPGSEGQEPQLELELELPPELLDPGTHRITLRLEPAVGDGTPGKPVLGGGEGAVPALAPASATDRHAVFERLSYRYTGEPFALETDHHLRWRYFSDLLNFGVSGSYDREKLGGLLFVGPQDLSVELDSSTAKSSSRLVAKVQNSSHGPATFRVRTRGVEVAARLEPHAKELLVVELPAAADEIRLEVEGETHGLFLWGAPTLVRGDASAARPPILLVTMDTTRWDVLSPYGGDPQLTPHLAELAERATVYERAFTTAPWTLPSHASIFTGLYPSRHGAGVTSDHLVADHRTLAERLRDEGYLTAGYAGGTLASYRFGLAQGFGVYVGPAGFEVRGHELTAEIEELLRAVGSLPFFVFVNYFDPHFPYDPPERVRVGDGEDRGPLPEPWGEVLAGDGEAWQRVISGKGPAASSAVLSRLRARYLGEIAYTDRQIGRLLALLEESGRFDDTLIVITSDHGELLGEGGYYSHTSRLDPELVEIPLIVKWPGQQTGERVEAPVSLVDLFPTLLRAGRAEVPEQDGLLLSPRDHQKNGPLSERRAIYAEEHQSDAHRLFANMKHGDHAWLVAGSGGRQLIWSGGSEGRRCLRQGTGGLTELECDDDAAVTAEELRQELGFDPEATTGDRIALTREEREALRALGYL